MSCPLDAADSSSWLPCVFSSHGEQAAITPVVMMGGVIHPTVARLATVLVSPALTGAWSLYLVVMAYCICTPSEVCISVHQHQERASTKPEESLRPSHTPATGSTPSTRYTLFSLGYAANLTVDNNESVVYQNSAMAADGSFDRRGFSTSTATLKATT